MWVQVTDIPLLVFGGGVGTVQRGWWRAAADPIIMGRVKKAKRGKESSPRISSMPTCVVLKIRWAFWNLFQIPKRLWILCQNPEMEIISIQTFLDRLWMNFIETWIFFSRRRAGIFRAYFLLGILMLCFNIRKKQRWNILSGRDETIFKWYVTSFLPEGLLYLFRIHKESPPGYFTVWQYTAYFPDRSLLHIMLGTSSWHVSRCSTCLCLSALSVNIGREALPLES